MKKAFKLEDIPQVVDARFMPVVPGHPFYVDFENLRDDFQERTLIRKLNVLIRDGIYRYNYQPNVYHQSFLFFAGMRGSGKTSELAKVAQKLHTPDCFLVVTCNIDLELNRDALQYMDVLVFQLEQLIKCSYKAGISLDDSIVESLDQWFTERIVEINRSLASEGNAELEVGGESENPLSISGLMGKLLGFTAKIKVGLSGSYERASTIRTTLKNRFSDFASQFNLFIEQVNVKLRDQGVAQEVLFIVDGLEKTLSADVRRGIIIGEKERIAQIRAKTIFTLPIELQKETQRISQSLEIVMFPFIKIMERNGDYVEAAIGRFYEFVDKRIDKTLFESKETIRLAIECSGGSPRQLLRIIEAAAVEADETIGKITLTDMYRTVDRLGNATARFIEESEYGELKHLEAELSYGRPGKYGDTMQDLLEKEIVFEYNGGSYKRVNPLVQRSIFYKSYVLGND